MWLPGRNLRCLYIRKSSVLVTLSTCQVSWERLKKEYDLPKWVINAHLDAIINLTPVKGSSYDKVQKFYEKLSKNFDALQTLGEGDKLHGFVMTIINKLPQVKPDLV